MANGIAKALAAAGILALLMGCATPRDDADLDREALRERAERVFKEQNRMSSRLMLLLPELRGENPQAYARLDEAESRMLEACEPLNRIAVAHRDEQSAALMDKINVPSSLDECERRTEQVRELIRELETHET